MSARYPDTILVRGRGIVAHAAAALLKRALPESRVILRAEGAAVVEPGAAGAVLNEFHRMVGIDDAMFRRAAGAVDCCETRFVDWIAPGRDAVVPENGGERFVDGVALHQLWLRVEGDGAPSSVPLERLLREDGAGGYRFDAERYLVLLQKLARHIGVEQSAAAGEVDLTIDCRAEAGREGWEDWSKHLPALAFGEASGGAPIEPDSVRSDGDCLLWAMVGRCHRLSPNGAPPGRRVESWTGNIVAVGPAAIALPPLYGLPLTLALADLIRLVRLLPVHAGGGATRSEYNRLTELHHAAALDWAAVPFALRDAKAGYEIPAGLAEIVAQFSHRGRIPVREYDFVPRGAWIAALVAMGLRPHRVDPTALVPDPDTAARMIAAAH